MRVTVSPEQIQVAIEAVKDDSSFNESRALWEQGRLPVQMIKAICLRAFSDPELVELSFLIGFINMLNLFNLFNNLLQVRYEGEYSLLERAS
jgi:hypothetical protein